MSKVKILYTQSGDWSGIYVNDKIEFQGHDINPLSLLRLSEEHNFGYRDVAVIEINDLDEESMEVMGRFPDDIKDMAGEY